jgi:hypothetical protein
MIYKKNKKIIIDIFMEHNHFLILLYKKVIINLKKKINNFKIKNLLDVHKVLYKNKNNHIIKTNRINKHIISRIIKRVLMKMNI